MRTLGDIAASLRTQDNRATALPVFVVEQRKRVYGFDPRYADDTEIAWVDSDGEADPETATALEAAYQETGKTGGQYTRTAYKDGWEFVTACFTEDGANEYLRINGHNLREPRIYVHSGYRNTEWETVRDHLLGAAP